jgi:gliding motility-associated-like protein
VVTVNPLPATITGDFQICNLTSTTLSSATPGGVWSSSDPFVASIDSFTGVVDAHVAGVTTITYTLTATGCYVATTFIVDPLPDTIAGTRVVCVGQTTVLSNAMGSGTWISQFPSIATIGFTTGIVTGISAGTTTITFTLPTGCDTTIVVTVNPLPDTIVGPSAICIGNTVTYTDATPGGTWSSTSGTISIGSATGIVTGLSAGTARITYTLSATGCRITKVITINPNPTAIKGFTAMCLGNTTTLFDSTHGGTWVSADTTIVKIISTTSSGDSIVVKGMAVGLTTITYTLPTGCFITALVTVHALPANIGGPSAVCAGSTITLTDSIAGGTWSVTPTAVATIVSTTGVLSGVTAGTAIVTYTNGQGCIKTKVITVNPLPAPISGPTDVCVGSTILLHDATPGGTWSTTDTLIATIDTGLVSGISMGDALITYTLTATGCAVTAIVHVRPLPNVTVNHPDILCRHASVLLSADGAGPLATYVWNPAVPTLSCDTCQETVASPSVTTTYTVTGYTSFGCKDTAMVTVVVDSILNNIHITGKDSICAGTCTTLYAEGFPPGSLFAWHPVSGLSCTICDTVVACPDATRTYFAIAIDSIGCKDSASITVHIMPLPVLDYLPRPAFVCKGDSTQLNAFSSVFGTTFAWFPNIFLTCDSCKDPIAYDTMNLVYRVIGTTPFGCYDSIRVPVSVLENSINTINADTAICTGKSVQIQANAWSADGSDAEYLWIPSTGLSNAHIRNPLATPAVTTTYSLVITPNACFSDTLQFTVLVAPYPDLSITPPNSTVVAGTMVPMVATVNNGVIITSYAWSPSNTLSCEACYNTIATPTVNTTYTFSAESNYGCASSTSATINIFCDNSQVFIPNTFTPNGDGMNDRFYISAKGINEITRFSIYNRWGELVYDAHNISPNNAAQGWDGTYKGLVQAPDVFIVIVDAICELGAPFHYKADVSIVR